MIVIGAIEDLSYSHLLAMQHQLVTLCGQVTKAIGMKLHDGNFYCNESEYNHIFHVFLLSFPGGRGVL